MIKKKDIKGDIEGFPIPIVEAMLQEQEMQGNKRNVKVFQENRTSGRKSGGFNWDDTIKGFSYWSLIINSRNFSVFISENHIYVKGDLIGFPVDIIDKMLYYQEKQGNKKDVKVFQKSRTACKSDGGFSWEETEEGFDYWRNLLTNPFKEKTKEDLNNNYNKSIISLSSGVKYLVLENILIKLDNEVKGIEWLKDKESWIKSVEKL